MIKYNIQKDSYEFDESSVGFFINVALQLTRRCNLKCIHCCEDGQMAEASIEQFKAVIDELAKEGCKKLCITGGEPLLRSDLVEILGYIHSKKMYSTLSTNGLILNKTKLTEMKPYINNIRLVCMEKKKYMINLLELKEVLRQ